MSAFDGLADRVIGVLESLAGSSTDSSPDEEPVVKVYVPQSSDIPAGFNGNRDSGGWYYTMTQSDIGNCPPPSRCMAVVDPEDVLYQEATDGRHDEAVGDAAAGLVESTKAGTAEQKAERMDDFVEAVAQKATEKSWIPYEGPQGGSGWENVETGDVTYDEEPPGDRLTAEDVADAALENGVHPDDIDEFLENADGDDLPGDTVDIDDVVDNMPMGMADVHLEDVMNNEAMASVLKSRAEREAGNRDSDAYYEALRDEIRGLSDDEIKNLAVESGMDEADVMGGSSASDTKSVERAIRSFDNSDVDLSATMKHKAKKRIEHDVGNAARPSVANKMVDHVGTYKHKRGDRDEKERAYFSGVARYGATGPDRNKGNMVFGASGSSDRTVTHEFGHALADAYGFDYQKSGSISHNYSDWDGNFDFGGKHPEKREMMLTNWGAIEDRKEHDWSDFEARAESRVDGMDEADIGDRVAARMEKPVTVDMFDEGDGVVFNHPNYGEWEGTVYSEATSPEGVMMVEYDNRDVEGQTNTIRVNSGNLVGGDFDDLPTEVVEGTITPNTRPGFSRDSFEEGETITAIEGEHTGNSEGSFGTVERPGELRVVDGEVAAHGSIVAEDDEGNEYYVHTSKISAAENSPSMAIKDASSGGETPITEENFPEMLKMRNRRDRDWVTLADFGESEAVTGQTVRFRFGTDDDFTEGVVTEETNGQLLVSTGDDDRWINKSQSFQQTVEIAEDKSEYRQGVASDSPPGLQEAAYKHGDYTEQDIDWDTYVQYEDEDDVAKRLGRGDLILIKVAGERVPAKISEIRTPDGNREMDVTYTREAAEALREAGADNAVLPDGDYGQLRSEYVDYDIKGHSPKSDHLDSQFEGVDIEPTPVDPGNLARGDVARWSLSEGPSSEKEHTGKVIGFGTFSGGGDDFVKFEDEYGDTRTVALDAIDVDGVAAGDGLPAEVTSGMTDFDDVSTDSLLASDGRAAKLRDNETGEIVRADTGYVSREMRSAEDGGDYILFSAVPEDDFRTFRAEIDPETGEMVGHNGVDMDIMQVDTDDSLMGGSVFSGDEIAGTIEPGMTIEYTKNGVTRVEKVDSVESAHMAVTESGETVEHGFEDQSINRYATDEDFEREDTVDDDRTDEEVVEDLMSAVNVAWHKMATETERGHGVRSIGSNYSKTNAHETLAMTHETMQSNTNPTAALTLHDKYPDLMEAYLDVFEPSDEVKEVYNEAYDDSPWASPFDEHPYPEVDPDVSVGDMLTHPTGDEVEVVDVDGQNVTVYQPQIGNIEYRREDIEQWGEDE